MPLSIPDICFATNNSGKIAEVKSLLKGTIKILSLKDIGCDEELPETHETFQENAREKALYVSQTYRVSCFADDSGLEVAFLNGAPGVYSARYAGTHGNNEANMALLLKNLSEAPNRSARFKTVISLAIDGKIIRDFEGTIEGTITNKQYGWQGFGYDPVFIPDGYDRTFAEMSIDEKNQISHRAKAIKKLITFLNDELPSVL